MLKSLSFFVRYFIFWILFFAFNRLAFEIWNADKFAEISFLELSKTFVYGMHMDASMTGYFCVIPFLIAIICWMVPKLKFPHKFLRAYTLVLATITILITATDFNIYTEWGTKINSKVLDFLIETPKEALASAGSIPLFKISIYILFLGLIAHYLYQWTVKRKHIIGNKTSLLYKIPCSLLILGLTFLAIRGGWKIAPMNPSQVYFSDKPILNHAALNSNWLLLSNYLKKPATTNPFLYFDKNEADSIVSNLYTSAKDSTTYILNTPKPNIVLVILESFTADVVAELGGEKGITPHFSALIKDGLLFKNIYSSSDRTDKGLIATLSAFPSQGPRSIIKENNKQEKLPSISKELNQHGYQTSFFYGGYTEFANFKSYLLTHQFKHLVDANSYESKDLTSKWGAYDEITFDKQLAFLNTEKQPFFSTLLTLTNHEPFEIPAKKQFGDKNIEDKFRSTSYYTSECIANYLTEAKKQDWYKNTLFIFVADHGHRLPKNLYEIHDAQRYRIPLLIYGDALKSEFKGQQIETYGNQTDLATTLLAQLKIPHQNFKYSANLLNPLRSGFSFFNWQNGFGLVSEKLSLAYDPVANRSIYFLPDSASAAEKETALNSAKALMQNVYEDYLIMDMR